MTTSSKRQQPNGTTALYRVAVFKAYAPQHKVDYPADTRSHYTNGGIDAQQK